MGVGRENIQPRDPVKKCWWNGSAELVTATKLDSLSSFPRTHMMEGNKVASDHYMHALPQTK